jgi:hypothetical protein
MQKVIKLFSFVTKASAKYAMLLVPSKFFSLVQYLGVVEHTRWTIHRDLNKLQEHKSHQIFMIREWVCLRANPIKRWSLAS